MGKYSLIIKEANMCMGLRRCTSFWNIKVFNDNKSISKLVVFDF